MLIVQDDTGTVEGANGYISVADFKAYHDARGAVYSDYEDAAIESGIIRATDYLDSRFTFVGRRLNGRDQSTEWPRSGAKDRDGYPVTGLPPEVLDACAEYAIRALATDLNPDPERDDYGRIIASTSVKVGPISESASYADGAPFSLPAYPAADRKLMAVGLVRSGNQVPMVRG